MEGHAHELIIELCNLPTARDLGDWTRFSNQTNSLNPNEASKQISMSRKQYSNDHMD